MKNLTIDCDECSLRHSTACTDCVVTFVLAADSPIDLVPESHVEALDLDADQARVIDLFTKAGLVPRLRHLAS